jgi:exosortase
MALLLHGLGFRTQQTRISLFAFILLIWGLSYYLAGPRVAGRLLFPCAYLIFCIPFTFLDSLSFQLRLVAASASGAVLNGLGVDTVRAGSAIRSVAGHFNLDVADPCSGLRSLVAMAALTALYGYVYQKGMARKWILFLSAIPLAIAGNIVRVVTIALAAVWFGQKFAADMHEYSGYIVFVAATLLMLGWSALLNVDFAARLRAWKERKT